MTEEKKGESPLNVLFPAELLKLPNGEDLRVTPLALPDLKNVITAFSRLMEMANEGAGPEKVAAEGLAELIELIPFCIDRDPAQIPAALVPDIVDIVIKQNLSEAIIKKWRSLTNTLKEVGVVVRAPKGNKASKK